MRLAMLSVPLLFLAVPTVAQETAPPTTAEAKDLPAYSKPKKVCRRFQVTGQRIAKSACYTAEQWAAYDKANEEAAKNFATGVNNQAGRAAGGQSNGIGTAAVFGLP